MTDFETKYRDLMAGLEAASDQWMDEARRYLSYSRSSSTPELLRAVAKVLDENAYHLRALLASSPAERETHDPHARLAPELVDLLDDWDANDEDDNYSKGDAATDLRAALTKACGCERGNLPHDRRCLVRLDQSRRPSPAEREGEGWELSRDEQRRRDNEPCPKCGGDRLRPNFTATDACHGKRVRPAPVVAPSTEEVEP